MKLLYVLLLLNLTDSLGQGTYQIRGRVAGVRPNAKLFLKKQDEVSSHIMLIDTTRYRSDGFVFRRVLPEVAIYSISIDSISGQVSFLFDHDIELKATRDAFKAATLTGSPLTDEWRSFEREVNTPFQEQLMGLFAKRRTAGRDTLAQAAINEEIRQLRNRKTQTVDQRIRQRPNSLLSLYLLDWYWMEMPKTEALTLFRSLGTPLKKHSIAGRLQQQLTANYQAKAVN